MRVLSGCFLGNWLVIAGSIPHLVDHCELILGCCDLGIVITLEKLNLEPTHRAQYLNADRHHLKLGLSNRFSNFQVLRCGGQVVSVTVSAFEDVTADSKPHSLSGMLCAQRQGYDAPPSVAIEESLVCLSRQFGNTSSHPKGMRPCVK